MTKRRTCPICNDFRDSPRRVINHIRHKHSDYHDALKEINKDMIGSYEVLKQLEIDKAKRILKVASRVGGQ